MASDTGQPNAAVTPPQTGSPSPHNPHHTLHNHESIMTPRENPILKRKAESAEGFAVNRRKASASSENPPSLTFQYAHFTPETVKSDLEATEQRAKKRKVESEQEQAVKRSKPNSDEAQSTPKPKNKGGRPRTAHLKEKKAPKGRTILKKSKPVFAGKNQLPQDLWNMIFERSDPEFLLKARHVYNREFSDGLNRETIWREARLNTYGPDHPPCPPTLNEMQYADLLTKLGCQARGCHNEKTRKTYWAYQRRWCDNCLHREVIETEQADQLFAGYSTQYRGCVPQAVFDSWRHYQWIGKPLDIPNWARMQAFTTPAYSAHDLHILKDEADAFTAPGPNGQTKTAEEITEWFDGKRAACTKIMDSLKKVEDWVKEDEKRRMILNKNMKAQRARYYVEQAAKMNPPVDQATLERMVCYKKAVQILRYADNRSWDCLEPKIKEAMEAMDRNSRPRTDFSIEQMLEGGQAGIIGSNYGGPSHGGPLA